MRQERLRAPGPSLVAGLGGLWGLAGYTILWEGFPLQVQRPFVESLLGIIVLLPVKLVLWAIHIAERVSGGPFDLSRNNRWIAIAAGVIGALIALGLFWAYGILTRRGGSRPLPRR